MVFVQRAGVGVVSWANKNTCLSFIQPHPNIQFFWLTDLVIHYKNHKAGYYEKQKLPEVKN